MMHDSDCGGRCLVGDCKEDCDIADIACNGQHRCHEHIKVEGILVRTVVTVASAFKEWLELDKRLTAAIYLSRDHSSKEWRDEFMKVKKRMHALKQLLIKCEAQL